MKVSEYIEKLKELDQDAEVMAEDETFGTLVAQEPIQYKGSDIYRPTSGNVVVIRAA